MPCNFSEKMIFFFFRAFFTSFKKIFFDKFFSIPGAKNQLPEDG